jgi:hypothetical protein
MSDQSDNDEIVTVDGKQYSRLMAEQIALDIDMVHAIKPGCWLIWQNSALIVGNVAFLSFALPLTHGYIIDTTDATDTVRRISKAFGSGRFSTNQPSLVRLKLPEQGMRSILRDVRPAHEAAIMSNTTSFTRRRNGWVIATR